jgi:hypothetical protein
MQYYIVSNPHSPYTHNEDIKKDTASFDNSIIMNRYMHRTVESAAVDSPVNMAR